MATLIRIDRNGTKYWEGDVTCPRCGGGGIYYVGVNNGQLIPSSFDNGKCWECKGTGKIHSKWKEYTPEYEAKRQARMQAKLAKIEEERKAIEEEEKAKEAKREAEIKARKAISQYVGELGERIELMVTYEGYGSFERTPFGGFGTETVYVYNFKDESGNKLIWMTVTGNVEAQTGETVRLRGRVKDHREYRDEKQTVLQRCTVKK